MIKIFQRKNKKGFTRREMLVRWDSALVNK
jgi:hypothetical protein